MVDDTYLLAFITFLLGLRTADVVLLTVTMSTNRFVKAAD